MANIESFALPDYGLLIKHYDGAQSDSYKTCRTAQQRVKSR